MVRQINRRQVLDYPPPHDHSLATRNQADVRRDVVPEIPDSFELDEKLASKPLNPFATQIRGYVERCSRRLAKLAHVLSCLCGSEP